MLERLRGLVIIVNTLIPIVLLAAVATAFLYWKDGVAARWDRVEPRLVAIRDTADASVLLVQQTTTSVTAKLTRAADSLDKVATTFGTAAATVKPTLDAMEKVTVPGLRVETTRKAICGVEAIRKKKVVYKKCWPHVEATAAPLGLAVAKPFRDVYAAMATAAQPLADIRAALGELGVLKQLPDKATEAQAALRIVAEEALALAGPVGAVLQTAGYVALFLLVWYGLQFGARSIARIGEGWRLMAGR